MRTVTVFALLFLLLLVLDTAQAIRLPREFASSSSIHGKLQKEANWVGASINREVVLCEDEHCSGAGENRKPTTYTRSTSESTKGERMEDKPTPSHHESHNNFGTKREDLSVKPPYPETTTTKYPDVFDLAGMDYSPARRRPPIHN